MNITFSELRSKDVINTVDGKRLGRVCDMVISCDGCTVLGIVVPGEKKFFASRDDLFIPWNMIQKIGQDVILVNLPQRNDCPPKKPKKTADCDYIIEDDFS